MKYNFSQIEKKWQKIWDKKTSLWKAKSSGKKKIYILPFFPYPSGEGLHIGHMENYIGTDIPARYYRMKGYNVLHPMGWDAFGLPAENFAIKMKKNPTTFVPKNIENFKKQLKSMGFSYDWQKELNTTDPKYYKWTQWMFLKMFKLGLAYEAESPINFCPSCKTGLAREESAGGKCERCKSDTEIRYLKQWHLKITKYSDRLIEDLKEVNWPESIKELQKNWVGKSEGYEIKFSTEDKNHKIDIFTTRTDTLFGVTFLVLAPEHPLALRVARGDYYYMVEKYLQKTLSKPERGRMMNKEITGVFTGNYAIHPFTGSRLPIWISEYVLYSYGTGAIMAVPAHDKRDYDFAVKFHLPIDKVIEPPEKEQNSESAENLVFGAEKPRNESPDFSVYEGYGKLKDSEEFTGLNSTEAIEQIGQKLLTIDLAKKNTYYKLRDWVFSRQRYWGEPIPIIKCQKCGNVPVPEKDLPVKLPKIKSFTPTGTGESPLKKLKNWVKVRCPKCHGWAERETNTMPQWAGSCWYYLRFIDPSNKNVFASPSKLKYWLPVNLYVGGAEHAVLHLLYARFWHKVFYDLKLLPINEPFYKLVNQGTILGEDNEKMAKSRGNIVNPADIVKNYGADSIRMHLMFMGPFEAVKPWSTDGIKGVYRFLNNTLALGEKVKSSASVETSAGTKVLADKSVDKQKPEDRDFLIELHQTIKKVGEDIENFKFNTAISSMMELLDLMRKRAKEEKLTKKSFFVFLKLLFPFAPHITQELWQKLGKKAPKTKFSASNASSRVRQFLDKEKFPEYSKKYLVQETKIIIVQVNGKRRLELTFPIKAEIEEIKTICQKNPKIKKHLKGNRVKKIIFAGNKIVNFVTN